MMSSYWRNLKEFSKYIFVILLITVPILLPTALVGVYVNPALGIGVMLLATLLWIPYVIALLEKWT